MVPFAGYSMPLSYGAVGAIASHTHVRESVGLFDVGHMMQTKYDTYIFLLVSYSVYFSFRGATATQFLEWLTPSSLSTLEPFSSTLSVLLNERGGIIDDTIITKHAEGAFYVVTNAGRRDRDLPWFKEKLEEWNASERAQDGKVELEVLDNWGLLALQGPEAANYLQKFTSYDLKQLTFGKSAFVEVEGHVLHVARGGYTGEDGFEVSVDCSHATVWLYGNPLHFRFQYLRRIQSRSPTFSRKSQYGLPAWVHGTAFGWKRACVCMVKIWTKIQRQWRLVLAGSLVRSSGRPSLPRLIFVIPIGKDRREKVDFIGAENVLRHLKDGPPRRRVGIIVEGAPARRMFVLSTYSAVLMFCAEGAKIYAPSGGEQLGKLK